VSPILISWLSPALADEDSAAGVAALLRLTTVTRPARPTAAAGATKKTFIIELRKNLPLSELQETIVADTELGRKT
jgi:hypothetical protein